MYFFFCFLPALAATGFGFLFPLLLVTPPFSAMGLIRLLRLLLLLSPLLLLLLRQHGTLYDRLTRIVVEEFAFQTATDIKRV